MPWVSIREASEMLQVSLRTVQRLVAAHTLPSRLEQGRRLVLLGEDEEPASRPRRPAVTPQQLHALFDLWEDLTALEGVAVGMIAEAKLLQWLEELPCMEDKPRVCHWKDLHQRVVRCRQQVSTLVGALRVDQQVCLGVLRAMLKIQTLWTDYECRRRDLYVAGTGKPRAEEHDPQVLIPRIQQHLRTLLIGCACAPPNRSGGGDSSAVS